VSSGTFVVDSSLSSVLTVKSGGTLAGQGQVFGSVTVEGGGTVAPGAAVPFSTLSSGNLTFQPGSIFRVNVNASGQNDKLQTNTATLTGGTVNVLAQNGTYAPSTRYTILTGTGTGAVSGTFSSVTSNLAFLTPSLSYDDSDVFLTLATNGGATGGTGFGFATVTQTRNQNAVATALDASPVTDPLVKALFNQTADGARQAFDALSGEVFGSVQTTQAGQTQFARSAMLGRLRQASYSGAPDELGALAFGGPELAQLAYAADGNGFPVKAPGMSDRSRDLTFWAQGLGGWGHTDSDGNAASVSSRFGGFLSGVDARYGDTLRAGLVAGYLRSDLNAAARSSSAGIDSVQLGAYAGGRLGAFNVRGGASYSYDSIDTSRAIAFPGFTDQTQAHFHGHVGQVFGEVGYGMTFNQVAVEPLAGLAYVHLHNGAFLESGGVAALSGSSVNENIGYSSLGVRAATALPLANGTVLVPRGSLQWQHAFGDVTPAAALAFQGTGAAFSVAGVPIARDTALVESGFDWRFSPQAKLGAYYQGELAAHAQAHAFKGTFNWNF
jgi:outer membrane autotransporter protein